MFNGCLDLQSIFAIIVFIISSVTLYGVYTTEHKVLRAFVQFVKDWFAFDLRWFGINPIIWLLYVVGFLDLFACFNGKFTGLSSISSVPFAIISFSIVILGGWAREKEITKSFPNENIKKVKGKIGMYTIYEILATGFGLVFGTVALWEYLLHDENVKFELVIMSLIVPNVLSIVARGFIRQSVIAEYLGRPIMYRIKCLKTTFL